MASFLMANVEAITFGVYITGLEHPANKYDYFRFKLYQEGTLIYNYKHIARSSDTGFTIVFSNDNWLGWNYVTPMTTYDCEVVACWNGVGYSLGTKEFTTESISPPSGTITPSVYTAIKSQRSAGSCVAMSLSTAMDIFKAKQTGITYENYSVSYIYGNGGLPNEQGMSYKDAVISCKNGGSPRWELVEQNFETKLIDDSNFIYQNADSYARNNAILQAFDGYQNIDFYDCAAVANAIRTYGYFMFNFLIPNNFNYIGLDGIVPQPNYPRGDGHSIALIGLTVKNGKPHWIAHNSWGTGWGAGGICYIPYDWGCGVLAPTRGGSSPTSWTQNCYSVWNTGISSSNPTKPTNIAAVKTGDKSALVSWDSAVSGALFTVFASKKNSGDWYIKGRTTNKSLAITFDNYDTYEIRVLASVSNLYSDNSIIAIVTMLNILPWEWQNPKTQGTDFNLTPAEWLAFCNKINEVRVSKGLSAYSFTTSSNYISKDKPFYAWIWLQACNAINEINNQVDPQCLGVVSGDDIYAWYFNDLKTALNNALL